MHVNIFNGHFDQGNILVFHLNRIEIIITVGKLDDFAHVVTDRLVISDVNIFQGFDNTSLNIARFRGLDCSINETNTTSHSVKEHFIRSESTNKGVFNEPPSTGWIVVFSKMRQSSMFKTVGDTFSFHTLLSQTGQHLRNVNRWTLGTGIDNHQKAVAFTKTITTDFTGLFRSLV